MTRTFIAIELHDEAREALRREIARLRAVLPGVRFVDPASLHLTLAFLGELDDKRLAEATTATEEVAAVTSSFAVRIAGIGTFGGPRVPRVIWAGVTGDVSALVALQSRLVRALEAHGFAREGRPFAPHLTLARLKGQPDAESAQRLETLVSESSLENNALLPVQTISVMKSDLLPSGARYTRLRAVPLAAPGTR